MKMRAARYLYGIPDVTMFDNQTKGQLLLTIGCGGGSLIPIGDR